MVTPIQTAFGPLSVFKGIPAPFQTGHPLDVLDQLDGPAAFVLDSGHERARIVSCLIHGNEPSGLNAITQAFQQGAESPHANMIYFVGNVRAAKEGHDFFTHRLIELPGIPESSWDMNRIWLGEQATSVQALTTGFFNLLHDRHVEAVIDLHNTSGKNPVHAVMLPHSDASAQLAGMYVDHAIRLTLSTALIGAMNVYAPSVIIECGKRGLEDSDRTAQEVLKHFLAADRIGTKYPRQIYQSEARVHIDPQVAIDFSDTTHGDKRLSLRPDLDSLNFNTAAGRFRLGHYNGETLPLTLSDTTDPWDIFFDWDDDGSIWLRAGHTIAMATMNEKNIRTSCLFFLLTNEAINLGS